MKLKSLVSSLTLCSLLASCGGYNESYVSNEKAAPSDEQLKSLDMNTAKRKLLHGVTTNVIAPSYEVLNTETEKLSTTIDLYCEALEKNSGIEQAESAIRNQWKVAVNSLHFLESFMIGPITGYLENIYSRELINTCGIDTEIIKANTKKKYKGIRQTSKKGFRAVEYLMFDYKKADLSCRQDIDMVNEWNKKDELSKKKDRCKYLQYVAKDLTKNTAKFNNEWSKDGGNYPHKLANQNILGSIDETINEVTNAGFFVEITTKDKKLGIPTGFNFRDCPQSFCPWETEHILSKHSVPALVSNLKGTRALFTGLNPVTGERGFGLGNYLTSIDRKIVATMMVERIDNAISNLEKLPAGSNIFDMTLNLDTTACQRTTSENREVEVCALYKDLKQVADVLKTEFLAAMKVAAPRNAQGDQD